VAAPVVVLVKRVYERKTTTLLQRGEKKGQEW
jgi:hypothetical protein